MGSWKYRFETIIAEVEDEICPTDVRRNNLRKVYVESMWECFRDLSSTYRNGNISQETFDEGLIKLSSCHKELSKSIQEVNFYEEF